MSERSPTIVDVAAHAGVSTGTVSNVLSGSRHVRPETRARVEAAFAELQFRPNRIARALSQRRTSTIAMVIPDVTNPFFAELVRTVEQSLAAAGYAVLFGNAANDADAERRYLTEFADRRVDAIVAATAGVDTEFLHRLGAQLPTILVDRVADGWTGDLITDDNDAGMTAAVDHLVELGHRHIGFLDGQPTLSTGRERLTAVRRALRRHGLELTSAAAGPFTLESGYRSAHELLTAPDPPTAICAASDLQALGALRAARDVGASVPTDLSITGYDDIPYATYVTPSLTTVRQPVAAIAAEIVALVLRRLDRPLAPPKHVELTPELVIRDSTAPPRPTRNERTTHAPH
jgi:LacI family transcriptional regulator